MVGLDEIFNGLGISKVRLAKYLGVSRQMVYNYLELNDLEKWPKEKKIKLFNLLNIKNTSELKKIKYDSNYIMEVESRLNQGVKESSTESLYDFKGLNKSENEALSAIINLLKERFVEGDKEENIITFKYLLHFLQVLETSDELKYFLAYVSKSAGYTKPLKFEYNKEEQFAFESIIFAGFRMYRGKKASPTRIASSHKEFVQKIEQKNEERLSRTQKLESFKIQALKELGYDKLTEDNAKEFWQKMGEIESRNL